ELNEGERVGVRTVHQGVDEQVRTEVLDEGNVELGGVEMAVAQPGEDACQYGGHQQLHGKFLARGEAEITFVRDFCVVVNEADGRVRDEAEHGDPNVDLREIGPEQ